MKMTFGMIVCNGDDFLKECLEAAYPYAHKICIAEGATEKWMEANGWDSPRSRDKTIEIIEKFPDPRGKISLFMGGPYTEKTEQCNSYMDFLPEDSDYLWNLDADELYFPQDVEKLFNQLEAEKYTYVELPMLHFFKNFHTIGTGGSGWAWNTLIPRIFKAHPGCRWLTHRPPTILDNHGIDLRKGKSLVSDIHCMHYSYVTDKQVLDKMRYYQLVFKTNYMGTWYKNVWQQWTEETKDAVEAKYSTHPTGAGGKTAAYTGSHPAPIARKYGLA